MVVSEGSSLTDIPVENQATKIIEIDDIHLHVLEGLHDANWYQQRHVYEEKNSLLYSLLGKEGFINFVDIGANYGYVSILMRKAQPEMNILAVEADARLSQLIGPNFQLNGLTPPQVINAIAGDTRRSDMTFSINPKSSLDNRVKQKSWQQASVDMIAVADAISSNLPFGKTFIKIDTQGYEHRVLKGLEGYLTEYSDWLLKMEFGPHWLKSQDTNPLELLHYLNEFYEFAEMPARVRFNTKKLDALFDKYIQPEQFDEFIDYVLSLNKNGLGWVDLIVRKKA